MVNIRKFGDFQTAVMQHMPGNLVALRCTIINPISLTYLLAACSQYFVTQSNWAYKTNKPCITTGDWYCHPRTIRQYTPFTHVQIYQVTLNESRALVWWSIPRLMILKWQLVCMFGVMGRNFFYWFCTFIDVFVHYASFAFFPLIFFLCNNLFYT